MDRVIYNFFVLVLVVSFSSCEPTKESQFYSNGELEYEVPLKNGKREGEMISYLENGNISVKASFKSGKLNGLTTGYDSLGNVVSRIEYKDDLKHGKAEMFYSNGNAKSMATHEQGKLVGPLLEYYENGDLSKRYYFDSNSEIIYFKSYSRSGVLYESLLPVSTSFEESSSELTIGLNYSEYDSAGMLILIGNLDEDNKLLDTLEAFKVRDLDYTYKLKPNQKEVTGVVYELELPDVNIGGNYFFKFEN